MAYQVDRYNGTFLVSVEDGTIDTSTDIRFVGKNYAGYGEVQNENFLHLLENFANTSAPPKAISGQIWYDSSNKKLKFYDGNRFKIASGAETGSSAPSGLTPGDFWFNSETQQLYCWSGSDFILIGPEAAPEFGTSAAVGAVVYDDNFDAQPIIKLIAGDETIAIISKRTFTLNDDNPITGFTGTQRIKTGITLINTDATTGVTSSTHRFHGTASNSLRLNGFEASNFIRADQPELPAFSRFFDSGFYLGNPTNHLYVYYDPRDPLANDVLRDENQVVLWSQEEAQPITFRLQQSAGTAFNVLKIRSTGLFPGDDNVFSIGSDDKRWGSIYVSNVFGTSIKGNITATDESVIINNQLKTIKGSLIANDDALAFDPDTKTFFGTLGTPSDRSLVYGDLIGDVTGSAQTANALGIYLPSIATLPETVVIRDTSGRINVDRLIGTSDKADRIKIDNSATDTDPTYRTAKTTKTADSIAARDGSGNLLANLFDGTATAARYADLAEKYLPDADYEVGIVVAVGGEKEITAAKLGDRAIGVISENPAFRMNSELEGGVYVALKGRVPVKVIGRIHKGDKLVSTDNGVAIKATFQQHTDVFAIALETSDEVSTKLIEAIIL